MAMPWRERLIRSAGPFDQMTLAGAIEAVLGPAEQAKRER
jgi:hypothetical protein